MKIRINLQNGINLHLVFLNKGVTMVNKRLKKYIINEYHNSDILESLLYFIPKGNNITIVALIYFLV